MNASIDRLDIDLLSSLFPPLFSLSAIHVTLIYSTLIVGDFGPGK